MSDQVLVSNEALKEYFTRMEHIFLVVVSHVSCDEFSGSSCCTVTLLLTFSSKNVSCNRSSLVYICALLFVFLLFESFFSVFLSPQPYDPMTLFPQQKTMIRMKVIAKIQHGIRVGEVCSS